MLASAQASDLQNLCLGVVQGVLDLRPHLLVVSVDCFGTCAAGESMTSVTKLVIHLNVDVILCIFYFYF